MHALLATIAAISLDARTGVCPSSADQGEQSLLDAIYSPLTAAAVFLVAVAKAAGPISDETANLIRDELKGLSGHRDVTELLVFSGWITEHERSLDLIAGKYEKLWRRAMTRSKRRALVVAASNVVACCGATNQVQLKAVCLVRDRLW